MDGAAMDGAVFDDPVFDDAVAGDAGEAGPVQAGAQAKRGGRMKQASGSQPGRPLMVDVARLAGVSHQTVSRVLNDHPHVSAKTRAEVLAAIRDLGYRPNAAARTLATGRTNALGVISVDNTLYGPSSMLYGLEQAAPPNYMVAIARLDAFDRQSLSVAVERFLGQAVEGIIMVAPQVAAVEALISLTTDVPLVAIKCGTGAPVPSVTIDNLAGAARATRYLLDLGHETVHHLGGPPSWLDSQERADGWRKTLRAAGAEVPPLVYGDWSARSGYEIGHRLAARPEVTAVLCGNDQMALGLLRALAEQGRSVPGDVSVVGFDDIPEAAFFPPPLTTVRQDFGELGRRAMHLLMDRIRGVDRYVPSMPIMPDLVVRASAAPPKRRSSG
jgi:DNA-binding LacI/PurR family transcriptional regulator